MVNIDLIIKNLKEFYPPDNKKIIHAGIGGGILTGYSQAGREVIAIDNDEKIIRPLTKKLIQNKLENKFTVLISDFTSFRGKADFTFFEFCMHEMENQNEALTHAKNISDVVLIADHARNSDWAHYTCETEKIESSWNKIYEFSIIKSARFETEQTFNSYKDIYNKLSVLGEESINRIKKFEGKTKIKIKMPYEFCLI